MSDETEQLDPAEVPFVDRDQPAALQLRRREQRNKTRVAIRSGALLTRGYLFMNALSAVIASYGLLANSPAVVIGAMIVALLLGPIMGFALGLSDGDVTVLRKSGVAVLAGGALVFAVAAAIGAIHDEAPITPEIMARSAPNLFDLVIALAGGAAGAYATVTPRVGAGFVGVAIATALVPPLASSAILLVRGDVDASLGAFVLAFTNIVAIQFAAALVLWIKGFARDSDGSVRLGEFIRRHAVGLVVLAGLGMVLAANLNATISQQLYESRMRSHLRTAIMGFDGNRLTSVDFIDRDGTHIVRVETRGPYEPSVDEVAAMAAALPDAPHGEAVDFRLRHVQSRIVTPQGYRYDAD